eukprot:scaffold106480_cov46-Prasinocladus_malaysianus.AAC.1
MAGKSRAKTGKAKPKSETPNKGAKSAVALEDRDMELDLEPSSSGGEDSNIVYIGYGPDVRST